MSEKNLNVHSYLFQGIVSSTNVTYIDDACLRIKVLLFHICTIRQSDIIWSTYSLERQHVEFKEFTGSLNPTPDRQIFWSVQYFLLDLKSKKLFWTEKLNTWYCNNDQACEHQKLMDAYLCNTTVLSSNKISIYSIWSSPTKVTNDGGIPKHISEHVFSRHFSISSLNKNNGID